MQCSGNNGSSRRVATQAASFQAQTYPSRMSIRASSAPHHQPSGEFIVTHSRSDHYTIIVESAFATANIPAFALDIDQKARFNIP